MNFIRFIIYMWRNRHMIESFKRYNDLENTATIIRTTYKPNGDVVKEWVK